ncbi:MAG TPA: N-acetylmuramoyl-L-alanine amidase [Planctomycetota bacterium]|nr:N-acetylmuramoyl-L-alanine amidase [Planctomycetota bacterium]
MRKATAALIMLLTFAHGCANYVTTTELADRLGGAVEGGEGSRREVVSARGHQVIVEDGTRLVIVDGKPVLLRHPSRMQSGTLKVSDDVFNHIPEDRPRTVFPSQDAARQPYQLNNVLIDPGHGGQDLGASYGGVHEKEVNLDVARALADELRRHGMHVGMTRDRDTFLTLEERCETANTLCPDLVVSVHANAAPNRGACGVEVFYVAETFTEDARRFDDTSRAVELNVSRPTAAAAPVTAALLARQREESRELAGHIERAMVTRLSVPSRGVKPAGFAMLKWTRSPAVLVEVGFLSNVAERGRLADAGYRRRVAQAVAGGILSYREWYERVH